MKKIYYARHGLSEMNVLGLFSGAGSDTILTDKGRLQARQAGKKVKESGLNFDIIIASPLKRAHETALLIAKELGFPSHKIILQDLLKERHFGELEGAPFLPGHGKNPHLLDDIPGIETMAELHERAKEFIEWLNNLEHETILVVGHGAMGRAIRRTMSGQTMYDHSDAFDNATIEQLA
ncbi:MAG: histidine phosphatase family protein [bacterium]|nr:histidine phosphatase family protein [bacterium]